MCDRIQYVTICTQHLYETVIIPFFNILLLKTYLKNIQAYANAKAALAKKLPASFLKSGTTRMVRIGPGGVVRSEEGKIVTTLGRLTGSTLIPPHNKKKMAAVAEQEAKMRAAAAAAAAAAARKTVTGNPLFKDDDNDEDLTCTMCLSSFWYRNELIDHMKNTHNVEKPEKHLKAK